MAMYNEAGVLLKDHGRDMSYQAVRSRYTDGDAPGSRY